MKNKKLLYVLLPLVLSIWGVIFYKIYTSMDSSNTPHIYSTTPDQNDSNAFTADTFSIKNNYRDPFLSKAFRVVKSSKIGLKHIIPPPKPLEIKWPSIIYNGTIRNNKSREKLVLVKIDGSSNFMSRGSSSRGVELTDVYSDSIKVVYKGEIKVIKKCN